ncbi:HNH endonuclease signature motif containing protein [Pseudomonas putida]|uniref:HNH nuclease domain-containing protein n=1 Tax=Pseudomonas putida TaxID=303 RepID=A0A6S5U095_PSEPU|nr:HNH endonuclease signature motif containing protein [Pseudomonas putida]BBT40928.1 hypothetical protein WP8W18C01_32690 [Pseudomonas putida]BBT41055.1 hypothetical protein WP8W18C01_33960 [Pseudomonas putida]
MKVKARAPSLLIGQDELKERLEYDPETGLFFWKISTTRVTAGDQAGRLNSNGYLQVWILSKRYVLHRLAFLFMEGAHPPEEVDHIDGCRTNNKWDNLRHVSGAENSRNLKRHPRNRSGTPGVRYNKKTGDWDASIQAKGKTIYLGSYSLKFDAKQARLAAEKKYGYHENHGKRA